MNHKTLFILGLALVTFAAAMGVRIALTPTDTDSAEHARITDDPQPHQSRASSNFDRPAHSPQHSHRPASSAAREATERAPFAIGLPDGAGPELIKRAEAVERHAIHELEQLTRRLDLSGHQRAPFPHSGRGFCRLPSGDDRAGARPRGCGPRPQW